MDNRRVRAIELFEIDTTSMPLRSVAHAAEDQQKKKKNFRTSRQTQAGIGHSAPAHRGGHVQNRSRRRKQRRRRQRTRP